MVLDTATTLPPESLPLPSDEAVFPEDSTPSQPDSHLLPPGEVADPPWRAARGEGSPSTDPSTAGSDPPPFTSCIRPSVPSSLSPSDHSLLTIYTELHFNPRSLAEHAKRPLLEIVSWLNSPHIRPHLREIRKAFALSIKLRTTESRLTVIDALEDVIATTDDLVEKRRAATTLLRALSLPRRRRTTIHSTGTQPNPSPSNSSSPSSSNSSIRESKSAAVDELISFLNKDGTLNRTRLTDLADKIDREAEVDLDTESDQDAENQAINEHTERDEDDDQVDEDGEYDDGGYDDDQRSDASSNTPSLRHSVTQSLCHSVTSSLCPPVHPP